MSFGDDLCAQPSCGRSRAQHSEYDNGMWWDGHVFVEPAAPAPQGDGDAVAHEAREDAPVPNSHMFVPEGGPRWHAFAFGPRESCADCGGPFSASYHSPPGGPARINGDGDAAVLAMGESVFKFVHALGLRGKQATLDADVAEARDHEIYAAGRAEGAREERDACRSLFESIDPASDEERLSKSPGAGAMGAVLEYRDAIARRGQQP